MAGNCTPRSQRHGNLPLCWPSLQASTECHSCSLHVTPRQNSENNTVIQDDPSSLDFCCYLFVCWVKIYCWFRTVARFFDWRMALELWHVVAWFGSCIFTWHLIPWRGKMSLDYSIFCEALGVTTYFFLAGVASVDFHLRTRMCASSCFKISSSRAKLLQMAPWMRPRTEDCFHGDATAWTTTDGYVHICVALLAQTFAPQQKPANVKRAMSLERLATRSGGSHLVAHHCMQLFCRGSRLWCCLWLNGGVYSEPLCSQHRCLTSTSVPNLG